MGWLYRSPKNYATLSTRCHPEQRRRGGNFGTEVEVAWRRENLSNPDLVDLGDAIYFVRETHPETIGSGLSKWFAEL